MTEKKRQEFSELANVKERTPKSEQLAEHPEKKNTRVNSGEIGYTNSEEIGYTNAEEIRYTNADNLYE